MAGRQLATINRRRTHKMFIDSRDVVSHSHNPAKYSYALPETIPNCIQLRLLSFRVPYSPSFVVIRTSKWLEYGTGLEQMDTVHQQAVALEKLAEGISIEEMDRVLTIYKDDGTVSLNIIETFTFSRSRDSDDAFRTYDVFVCTGTLATSVRTDWRLQDPAQTDTALQDISLVGSSSDTAPTNGGTYAASDPGSSNVAVNIVEDNLYLKLHFGQGQGRLNSVRTVYPAWKSFQVYRKGDFVCHNGKCYTCINNHMSLIFADDALTLWDERAALSGQGAGPANDSFYVLETNESNEAIIMGSAAYDDIVMDFAPQNVSSINVEWVTRRGSHFMFPHSTAIEFLSFTDASNVARLRKEYRHHTLMIELTYQEEGQVVLNSDGTVPERPAMPKFLRYN